MFRATVDKDALQEWDAEFVETFSAINTELDVQDVTPVVPIKIVASTSWYARYADDGDQSPTLIAGARTSTCRIYSQSRARTLVSGSDIRRLRPPTGRPRRNRPVGWPVPAVTSRTPPFDDPAITPSNDSQPFGFTSDERDNLVVSEVGENAVST